MMQTSLAGTWRLRSFESRTSDGQVTYPWGKNASGYITYSRAGYVSVLVMSTQRSPYAGGDMKAGTVEEKAAAAETCIAYCGPYEVQGDTVIHHIEISLFPNWIGTDQKRSFEIDGNRLSLHTSPALVDGREQTFHLVWERA